MGHGGEDLDDSDGDVPPPTYRRPFSFKKMMRTTFIALLVALVPAIIIIVAVVKIKNRNKETSSQPSAQPSASFYPTTRFQPSVQPSASFSPTMNISKINAPSLRPSFRPITEQSKIPTMSPSTELYNYIASTIDPLYPNEPLPLLNSSSPQYKALTWMTYNDNYDKVENYVQRFVVVVIYFSFNGYAWKRKNEWLTSISECDWYGIKCESIEFQNVYEVNLGSNNVKGGMPREIGLLPQLYNITLENNRISGTIPSSIGLLTNIKEISLWGNAFVGTIPSEISNLSFLSTFDL